MTIDLETTQCRHFLTPLGLNMLLLDVQTKKKKKYSICSPYPASTRGVYSMTRIIKT